jgi:hypothetical protein
VRRQAGRRQAIAEAVAAAHDGIRPWLLGRLTPAVRDRIAVLLAFGISIAMAVLLLLYHSSRGGITWGDAYWDCGGSAVMLIVALHLLRWLLRHLVSVIRWSLWRTR